MYALYNLCNNVPLNTQPHASHCSLEWKPNSVMMFICTTIFSLSTKEIVPYVDDLHMHKCPGWEPYILNLWIHYFLKSGKHLFVFLQLKHDSVPLFRTLQTSSTYFKHQRLWYVGSHTRIMQGSSIPTLCFPLPMWKNTILELYSIWWTSSWEGIC